MELFDLPAPLFDGLDQLMAMWLPVIIRLTIWGAIGGAVTVGLYRLFSPQVKIGGAKHAAQIARRRLYEFDGELADAAPLIRDQFITTFKHIGLVLPATLAAMLPMLALLVWLEASYTYGNASYLPVGPEWARSWMMVFFPVMMVVSVLIYRWAGIK